MLKTELGQQLWNKYAKSKTQDAYITAQTQNGNQYAETLNYVSQLGIVKYNKISLNLGDKMQISFSSLNNLDVSKSEGRKISLISFNETTTSGASNTRNAKTYFHEMKAHIDLANNNRSEDNLNVEHNSLGVAYNTDSRGQTTETILPNTPMDNYNNELELNNTMDKIAQQYKYTAP